MANIYGNFSAKTVVETKVDVATTWAALPTTVLADRNYIRVYNKGENKLYLSFDSSASIKDRYAIGGAEIIDFPVQDNCILYGRTQTGGTRVIVQEFK